MDFRFCLVILILGLLSPSQGALINLNAPIKLLSTNLNYTTEYFFNISISSSIPSEAYIQVEFPFLLEESYSISRCVTYVKVPKGYQKEYECEKLDSRLTINMGEITPGNYQLLLENIRNPQLYKASKFKISTYQNKTILVDQSEEIELLEFLPSPSMNHFLSFHLLIGSINRERHNRKSRKSSRWL